jgi:hypothetical protein
MCVILTLAGCRAYWLFASNSVIRLDAKTIDQTVYTQDFNKRSVATIREALEQENKNPNNPDPGTVPQQKDLGRVIFVGDSRTVHMFRSGQGAIIGENKDGITVYALYGGVFNDTLQEALNKAGDNFDTLVSWMGANEEGQFGQYQSCYEQLLAKGKTIIVCTVGPTDDTKLSAANASKYAEAKIQAYNSALTSWAASKNVQVIDTYSYVKNNVQIDSDGIHYTPQPTTDIWNYIKSQLNDTSSGGTGDTTPAAGGTTPTLPGSRPAWAVPLHGVSEAGATDAYNHLRYVKGLDDATIQANWDALMAHYAAHGKDGW